MYKDRLNEIENIALMILVWGPASGGGILYNKRVQILNVLRGKHRAFFSEQIDADHPTPNIPTNIREAIQADLADLIVVIQAPFGSTGEIHDFGHIPTIMGKMLIFLDEQGTQGYSYKGTLATLRGLYSKVETYKSPEDLIQCNLLGRVMELVRSLQYAKFWQAQYNK